MSDILSSDRVLPAGFEALEPFAEWAVSDETERYAKRVSASYADIRAFYDAVLPYLDAAFLEVDRHSYDAMPADAERLYELLLAMMEAGLAIEIFGSSDVPNAVPASRIAVLDSKWNKK